MATIVLYINENYLKENTNISTNVDINLLKPSIIKAQDFYITDFIGDTIDTELKNGILNNNLTQIQKDLLDIIKKAQVEFTTYMAYVDIYARFLNKSANTPNTEAGSTISKVDLIYIRDISKQNGEVYLNQVRNFLIKNKLDFPSFSANVENCLNDKSAFQFQIEYDIPFNKYRKCNCIGICRCNQNYYPF